MSTIPDQSRIGLCRIAPPVTTRTFLENVHEALQTLPESPARGGSTALTSLWRLVAPTSMIRFPRWLLIRLRAANIRRSDVSVTSSVIALATKSNAAVNVSGGGTAINTRLRNSGSFSADTNASFANIYVEVDHSPGNALLNKRRTSRCRSLIDK